LGNSQPKILKSVYDIFSRKQTTWNRYESCFNGHIMKNYNKKILIVDEAGFCRICSAILENEGYGISSIHDIRQSDAALDCKNIGLVITSYPFGAHLLDKLKDNKIPTIVLSDQISNDLMMTLENFDKNLSYCMIKPLDYSKFRTLVNQTMNRYSFSQNAEL